LRGDGLTWTNWQAADIGDLLGGNIISNSNVGRWRTTLVPGTFHVALDEKMDTIGRRQDNEATVEFFSAEGRSAQAGGAKRRTLQR
jgi:hypothetical protein